MERKNTLVENSKHSHKYEKIEPGDFNMQLMHKQYVEVVKEHPLADKSKNSLDIIEEVF